jgi:tripartite-type tricarboxylate transporter receptor subunit TctC
MRKILAVFGGMMLAAAGAALAAAAADYPTKPIRLIVPYPPGAGTDGTARIVAEALGSRLGQQVVVENKPGASGTIGTDYVAKSPADGYTLLWTSTDSMTAVPALRPKMPYKVPDDFSYIAKFAETGMSLVVSAKLPVTSVAELIAYARANPGKVTYGTSGVGGSPHLATLLFDKYAGVTMTHVPYKGVAPALTDLLGGQIDFALLTPITIVPFLGSDKMRIIGITAASRHPLLPNAPTMIEVGLPQATATVWYGLFGPAKLPPLVMERLRKEIAAVADTPAVRDKMAAAGLQMAAQYGEDFEKSANDEFNQWKTIVSAEHIVVEE